MGIFGYYGRVIRVAFTHSLDIAQAVIFALVIGLGVVTYFFPGVKVTLGLTTLAQALTGWELATGVLGSIFLVRLALTPYWIHQELHQKVTDAARSSANLSVRFQNAPPYAVDIGAEQDGESAFITAALQWL